MADPDGNLRSRATGKSTRSETGKVLFENPAVAAAEGGDAGPAEPGVVLPIWSSGSAGTDKQTAQSPEQPAAPSPGKRELR